MPAVPSTDVRIRISATAASAFSTFDKLNARLGRPTLNMQKLNLQFRGLDRLWSLIAIGSGAAMIKTFVGMAAELQTTQLQLAAFTRDLTVVPDVMDSVIALTERVPFALNAMTASFVKMKAAGLDPIVDAQGNGPLKDLADAVAAFGGGEEIFKRATIAIQQMAGKGVISMEELRQQLGEAVPTAMRVMAEQLGVSVSSMINEISRGQLEFERGVDALFAGFREKFGGAGELLKTTFLGQLQQSRLEFEKLSKALLLDTGLIDQFAAAIKIFNIQINEFTQSLSGGEGTRAVDEFLVRLEKFAIFAEQALIPFGDFIDIIATLASTVAGATGSLPPEIIGGGILGFILFGKKGLAVGAIFGAFSQELSSAAEIIGTFVTGIIDVIKSTGVEDVAAGGLIGFLLFGKKGALVGLLFGIFDELLESIATFDVEVEAAFRGIGAALDAEIGEGIFENIFNREEVIKKGKAAGAAAQKSFKDAIKSGEREAPGIFSDFLPKDQVEGAETATSAIAGLMAKMRDFAKQAGDNREEIVSMFQEIKDVGGLDPKQLTTVQNLGTFLQRLEIRAEGAGSQIKKLQATIAKKVGDIDGIISSVTAKIDELGETDSKVAGLRTELAGLADMKARIKELGVTIVENMSGDALEKFATRANRLSETLDVFLVKSTGDFDAVDLAVQKVEARFAGFQVKVDRLTETIKKKTAVDKDQEDALKTLTELQDKLNDARTTAINVAKESIRLKQQEMAADLNRAATALQSQATALELANNFDEVGIAVQAAQERIAGMLDSVRQKIEDVQKAQQKGLITEEAAQDTIERLQRVAAQIQVQGEEFIERMAFNASDWGQLMNGVADSMQSGFEGVLDAIVNKTSSMRDVLVSFYNDITKAVIRYLAKQALVGIFGGTGGIGQALSGFFTGGLPGFANGGSFQVGGTGGRDNNIMSINGAPVAKVSKGETVNIDNGTGGGGGGPTIIIQALDAKSVTELFMSNGSALVSALNSRTRLNRGPG